MLRTVNRAQALLEHMNKILDRPGAYEAKRHGQELEQIPQIDIEI